MLLHIGSKFFPFTKRQELFSFFSIEKWMGSENSLQFNAVNITTLYNTFVYIINSKLIIKTPGYTQSEHTYG